MNRRERARRAAGARATSDSAAPAQTGVDNVSKKLEKQLEDGDYYGALQMYKTLFMRYLKVGDDGEPPSYESQEKAADLALEASVLLVQHDQSTAATEMAKLLVSIYTDFHHQVADDRKDRIRKISNAFQAKPQFASDLAVFLKSAVAWSSAEGSRKRGDPELQLLLAQAYRQAEDYSHSAKHYLHAEKPMEFADMLFDWSRTGYPSENELYITRATLQLLSLENLRDANKVYERYVDKCKEAKVSTDTPLFHFLRFLLLTLERDALPLFQMLKEKYANALARDQSLDKYMSLIGQKFFGLQPPRNGLSSLLDMLGGGM